MTFGGTLATAFIAATKAAHSCADAQRIVVLTTAASAVLADCSIWVVSTVAAARTFHTPIADAAQRSTLRVTTAGGVEVELGHAGAGITAEGAPNAVDVVGARGGTGRVRPAAEQATGSIVVRAAAAVARAASRTDGR